MTSDAVPVGPHPRPVSNQAGVAVAALLIVVGAPLYRRRHLRWGATDDEVASALPGDDLVPVSHFTATRAITIDASPGLVWPWLVQVGYGRAGFYSYDLLDNLGRPSADVILPEWQHPRVGDLAAPMASPPTTATSFRVAEAQPSTCLVWSKPDSTWAWRLTALPEDRTRLVVRLRQRYRPTPAGLLTVFLAEFGDFPMMRAMLRGIKRRAEQTHSRRAQERATSLAQEPDKPIHAPGRRSDHERS